MFVRHKIMRIGPKGLCGARRASVPPKAGTLACAGRRPAYMLVSTNTGYNMGPNTGTSTGRYLGPNTGTNMGLNMSTNAGLNMGHNTGSNTVTKM